MIPSDSSPARLARRDLLRAAGALAGGCARGGGAAGRLVLKHQPMWGDPEPFREVLDGFRRANPGVELVTETLPNSSDATHQFFLTALEGGASDFDVFVADIVWVAELARAGWVLDLSDAFPPSRIRQDFLDGAASAALYQERTFAVPWYSDVGVLYRRTDLVESAPRTIAELETFARDVPRRHGGAGYVWQGRQYEGLVCNACEAIWAHGGTMLQNGRLALDTAEAREAIAYMRRLIASGLSPRSVTSMSEEESRRVFQSGEAVFMRNWPYALAEAERPGSPIRGKVAISTIPTVDGAVGHGTLGGFHLAINANAPEGNRELAISLVRHLVSLRTALVLAVSYGRSPALRAAYDSEELLELAPRVAELRAALESAKPRPVTPFYPMLSDVLQSELSAAVADIRSPAEALSRAQAGADRIMGLL